MFLTGTIPYMPSSSIPSRTPRRSSPDSTADARERLLRAALDMIWAQGPANFKVLEVAARADANVALINYHFGGRDGLLREVLRRSGAAVAKVRSQRLDALVVACAPKPPPLEEVVKAWLQPVFEGVQRRKSGSMHALLSHLLFATGMDVPSRRAMVSEVLRVDARFVDVLMQCRPDLTRRTITWRMASAIGSYNYVFGQEEPTSLHDAAQANGAPASFQEAYEELLAFMVGGFGAPAPRSAAQPVKATRRAAR